VENSERDGNAKLLEELGLDGGHLMEVANSRRDEGEGDEFPPEEGGEELALGGEEAPPEEEGEDIFEETVASLLEKAGIEVVDDTKITEDLIKKVSGRVARRLLKELL